MHTKKYPQKQKVATSKKTTFSLLIRLYKGHQEQDTRLSPDVLAHFAQAGGKSVDGLSEAVDKVIELVNL